MEELKATLVERIEFLHVMGLDRRYDDVIGREELSDTDVGRADRLAFVRAGRAFDYQAQSWMVMNDHAHFATGDEGLPLLFCGSDITSCVGLERPAARS